MGRPTKNSARSGKEKAPHAQSTQSALEDALNDKALEIEILTKRCQELESDLARATDPIYLAVKLEQIGVVDAEWRERALAAEKFEHEVARLRTGLEATRETNRRLNRRIQQIESGQAQGDCMKELAGLRLRADLMSDRWFAEFERVVANHNLMKEIYETVAPVLGCPWGRYNSVTDARVDGRRRVFANVYLSEKGGIESHDVAACVAKAVAKLSSSAMPEGLKETLKEAKELIDLYQTVHLRLDEGEEWGSFDCGLVTKGRRTATYDWWLGYMHGAILSAMQEIIWSFPEYRPETSGSKAA